MNRKIINIGIAYAVIFLSLFFAIALLSFQGFKLNQDRQYSQSSQNGVSENPEQVKKQSLSANILLSVGIIFLGLFLSYKLINNPCNEESGPVADEGSVSGGSCRFE